jgi:peptide/nickel transport system ATP-binding protein
MRQRAIIAIALALGPEVIIMDEPTTALDVVVQREILMEIIALRKDLSFSVIFITHDLSLLLEVADKVAIMYAGRVVEMATRDELKQHARHPYSYGMLNSFPTIHGPRKRMTGIPGSPPDLRNIPRGCSFHVRCPLAFAACRSELPLLRPATVVEPGQQVACHLYDPYFSSKELPTAQDFAASYEAAYMGDPGERSAL